MEMLLLLLVAIVLGGGILLGWMSRRRHASFKPSETQESRGQQEKHSRPFQNHKTVAVVDRKGDWKSKALEAREDNGQSERRPYSTQTRNDVEMVSHADWTSRRLMNAPEYCVFKVIEQVVIGTNKGFRVMVQTNLGAILRTPPAEVHRIINCKRLDFLVIDCRGMPALAVEYHGAGHWGNTQASREETMIQDEIKRAALHGAGIELLEVPVNYEQEELRTEIRRRLRNYKSKGGTTA